MQQWSPSEPHNSQQAGRWSSWLTDSQLIDSLLSELDHPASTNGTHLYGDFDPSTFDPTAVTLPELCDGSTTTTTSFPSVETTPASTLDDLSTLYMPATTTLAPPPPDTQSLLHSPFDFHQPTDFTPALSPEHHFTRDPPPGFNVFLLPEHNKPAGVAAPQKGSVSPTTTSASASSDHTDRKRKRDLNTAAARRYRQRKVDRVTELEDALADVSKERDELKIRLAKAEAESALLRGLMRNKG